MLKGVAIGAGYFSRFHYEAWSRVEDAMLTALCNREEKKGRAMAEEFGVPGVYQDVAKMLDAERPDFVDIITPPETHLPFCREAFKRGIAVQVQKPLAPTLAEAEQIVSEAEAADVRIMAHENFRFQPWYREIKNMLDNDVLGKPLHAYTRMRMGDGWQADAYLARQPYFRDMPKLLVHETGIHFIDTYRYLFGEVESVYARLHKRNKVIAGEDAGTVHFNFASGATAIWDASRYHESNAANPRYTFGILWIDGEKGSLRLEENGSIYLKKLGEVEHPHNYLHQDHQFAGDCVFATIQHFAACLLSGHPFETAASDYVINMKIEEAVYQSALHNVVVPVS